MWDAEGCLTSASATAMMSPSPENYVGVFSSYLGTIHVQQIYLLQISSKDDLSGVCPSLHFQIYLTLLPSSPPEISHLPEDYGPFMFFSLHEFKPCKKIDLAFISDTSQALEGWQAHSRNPGLLHDFICWYRSLALKDKICVPSLIIMASSRNQSQDPVCTEPKKTISNWRPV